MRLLAQITEDEMIAVFLKAEIQSERFAQQIINKLDQDGQERRLVDRPDCTNPLENAYRRQLLASYRPYVLEELAPRTFWYRAMLRREELMEVCYIDYSYWNELSGYTRLPGGAVETIRAGRLIYGQPNDTFIRMAQAVRAGVLFPELILVGAAPDAVLTVLEGHVRLTAYALALEYLPAELAVIIGFAPEYTTI